MFIEDVLTLTALKDCPAKTDVPLAVLSFKDAALDEYFSWSAASIL
jgi:hypothetical protein